MACLVPHDEGGTMTDPAYDEEVPDIMVRCVMCQETMPKDEWDLHDCPIIPWEYIDD